MSSGSVPRLAALVLTSAVALQNSSVSQQSAPAAAERHHSFLWMLDAPAVDERLFASLDALGVSGTNVAGTAPSDLHGEHGRPFYVDHTAGKGPLYLLDEEWEPLREAFCAGDLTTGLARPRCLADPAVIAAARKRIDEVVRRARPNRPLAWSLDDEISISRRETPLDLCFAAPSVDRFRRFLAERYGSEAALTAIWDLDDPIRFEDVVPFTTHVVRRRALRQEPSRWNLAPWADHREFMERELTGAVAALAASVRALDPGTPVGFTGGGAPSPFSGLDWSRVLEHVDFVEPYDVGGTRELVRSFARPGTVVMHTLFPSPEGAHVSRHELWDYFLRGDAGVILWSSREWFVDGDVERPSKLARALAPTLRELTGPIATEWMRSRPLPAEVAVVESQPSNHLHWMLDSRWEGRSWIHRSTSYEVIHSSQAATREAWQKLLEDALVPYDHVDARDLDEATLAPYRVLILPRAIALSERTVEAITRFASRGTVIADCQPGLATERLAALGAGSLDRLFGVRRSTHRVHLRGKTTLGPSPPRAAALSAAEPDVEVDGGRANLVFDDHRAIIERRHGKHGRTVYLNLLVHGYLDARRGPSGTWLRELVARLIEDADLAAPVVSVRTSGEAPLRMFTRRGDHGTLVALLPNHRTSTRAFAGEFVRDTARVRVVAKKGHVIVPLRPRIEGERKRSIELELACDEPVIMRVVDASPDDDEDVRRK